MTPFDLATIAVGGAQRPDSFSGMRPEFRTALAQMYAAAPPNIQQSLRISSGYRSPQRQAELWAGALKKYGSPDAARKWVAPPGRSQHNHGSAADLKYLSPAATEWAHKNAGQFGLHFPLGNENWHIELAGSRGGHAEHKTGAPGAGGTPLAQGSALSALFSPTPVAAQTQPMTAPALFGDLVGQTAVQSVAPPDLASALLQNRAQAKEKAAEEERAAQERRVALLGENLFGIYG